MQKRSMLKIVKLLLENIPKIKKRGWVFSLIWKAKDISEIWTNYRSLKSNSFEIPKTINISHKIELKPNNFQKTYFAKASGISRFTWNWALGNWNEKYKNGEKPLGMSLKKEFNSLNATVSRMADKWFISFGVEASLSYLPCKNQASVGIDLGIKTLATLSNGTFIKSPKPLKQN